MKTLAIFGDSFASVNAMRSTSVSTAWPNQLDTSRWDVSNYAEPATSFYWTYRRFLKYHERYDQVVCIVTRPGRITLRDEPYVLSVPFSISGIRQAEWLLKQTKCRLNTLQTRQVTAMRDYLMYAQDYEYEVDANSQLLEHLKRVRPDAIFIPMSSALPNLRPPEHVMMLDFVRLIVASVRPELIEMLGNPRVSQDGWIDRDELEPIQCHLTPEVNTLVAGCVESALTTGIWAPQLPDYVQHSLAWEDYYRETSMFGALLPKFK